MKTTVTAAMIVLVLTAMAIALSPRTADAETAPGFTKFELTPTDTQAGGHPDVRIEIEVRTDQGIGGTYKPGCGPCLDTRSVAIHWPEGFIGNPHSTPKCTLTDLSTSSCPVDSQVGTFNLYEIFGPDTGIVAPVFNMETRPDQAGLLGLIAPFFPYPIFFELTGRTDSDYGLDATTTPGVRLPFNHFVTELWGVPPNPKHDPWRFVSPLTATGSCYEGLLGPGIVGCPPGVGEGFVSPTYAQATIPEVPFLQNPTTCDVPLEGTATVEYFGGVIGHASSPYPSTTGCQQASFAPSFIGKPTTSQADAPSGLDTDLKVPQTLSPITPSPSEMAAAIVTLPQGFTVNTSAADGKVACPESATAIGTLAAATCPEFSKIGSLMLDVAALPAPIPGSLYLLEPVPGDRYRVLIAADGFGTHVKLVGSVRADARTGQLTLEFVDLPQAPLQEFNVHIFGSERGLFATPSHCGTYPVKAQFFPWNNTLTVRESESFMTFDSGPGGSACTPNGQARPFAPSVDAGTETSAAGRHSPFSVTLNRADGHQNVTGVKVTNPPGFAATLRGIPYCPESAIAALADSAYAGLAEQASPSCPAASQVGTATAGAGAGTHPVYVDGKVYLAGPYKGAPLSLEAVLPAVSGPYDLGVIAVRTALFVDPLTAQVTAITDPLPQIKEGIPLRARFVRVNLNRQGFTFNPTNCEPLAMAASVSGDEGAAVDRSVHFQATNCASLPYEPKLSLKLIGGVRRLGHPAIHAVLRATPEEANTRRLSVTLPGGELLDNDHLDTICTRVQYAAQSCPAGSRIGRARVATSILDEPLSGSVYLRSSSNELPDMVFDLNGQVDIDVIARIDSVKGRLRATITSLPDAPLTEAVLDLEGGAKGLIQNSESLCGKAKKFTARMTGQNGATLRARTKVQTTCASGARNKRGGRGR